MSIKTMFTIMGSWILGMTSDTLSLGRFQAVQNEVPGCAALRCLRDSSASFHKTMCPGIRVCHGYSAISRVAVIATLSWFVFGGRPGPKAVEALSVPGREALQLLNQAP